MNFIQSLLFLIKDYREGVFDTFRVIIQKTKI